MGPHWQKLHFHPQYPQLLPQPESHLYGYIQNKGDGIVEICVQGSQKNIELFLRKIKNEKPILAHYEYIDIKDIEENKKYNDFLFN